MVPHHLSLYRSDKFIEKSNGKFFIKNKDGLFEHLSKLSSYLSEFDIRNVHLYGGGYLNSMWTHHLPIILGAKIVSKNLQAPLIATGQGFIPWDDSVDQYMRCLSTFDITDVRDYASFNVFQEKNRGNTASYSGDDALLLFKDQNNFAIKREEKPSLVICIQNDLFSGGNLLENLLCEEILSLFSSRGIKNIKFLSAMKNDSFNLSKEMELIIKKIGMTFSHKNENQLLHEGIPFHPDSFFITTRYHIHLIASFSGARGISIYSNNYYKNKHKSVNDMGSLWEVVDLPILSRRGFKGIIEDAFRSASAHNADVLNFWINKKKNLSRKILGLAYTPRYFCDDINWLCDFI
ncbi:polysaccharide pyruvyl transferase family protein [Brytella acorum]|uniref:Polysaccharide pyruvyl transferase domain-containing protein n=1 Tax=Brytella acorum TaxID=2959299 RepID=A0AA35UKS9_9PROT|nr:hypothetical protein [Brytella acorum]CAI9122287.1 hypothetical protein LMG32879_003147 [Brytella acorum]